jgi:transcriptional regulator with XRE-family HTH domain
VPRSALTGTRIRERRILIGMRQAELARAAGISASYLNLIEHNRRRVGEDVLAALARALGGAYLPLPRAGAHAIHGAALAALEG